MNKLFFYTRLSRLSLILIIAGASMNAANAVNDVADGDNGVLYVGGELVKGACNIDTSSRWQTLSMGSINSTELRSQGARAHGKEFHVHLSDCISSGTEEILSQTGNTVSIKDEPEIRVSFSGEQDPDESQLLAVKGAGGFGLRLEDSRHHLIQIGGQGKLLALQSGAPELTLWLYPERTKTPLKKGLWHSLINMRFSYE